MRASSQSLIGRSRNFSGQSVSDSSCTPSRGASRPSLQSTRRATTSSPNVSSVMTYDLLFVVRNHVILYNIRRYLNSYEYLDLLIATYNPLQEAWVFCERTRIFTCLRPPSPCPRSRRKSRSPASVGRSRGRPACPDSSANANCALIDTL